MTQEVRLSPLRTEWSGLRFPQSGPSPSQEVAFGAPGEPSSLRPGDSGTFSGSLHTATSVSQPLQALTKVFSVLANDPQLQKILLVNSPEDVVSSGLPLMENSERLLLCLRIPSYRLVFALR